MHHGSHGTILDLVQIVTSLLPAIGSNQCTLVLLWRNNGSTRQQGPFFCEPSIRIAVGSPPTFKKKTLIANHVGTYFLGSKNIQKWGSSSSVYVCVSVTQWQSKNEFDLECLDMLSGTCENQVTIWRAARPQRRCNTYIPKLSLVIGRSLDLSIALQYLIVHSQIGDSMWFLTMAI